MVTQARRAVPVLLCGRRAARLPPGPGGSRAPAALLRGEIGGPREKRRAIEFRLEVGCSVCGSRRAGRSYVSLCLYRTHNRVAVYLIA